MFAIFYYTMGSGKNLKNVSVLYHRYMKLLHFTYVFSIKSVYMHASLEGHLGGKEAKIG